VITMKRDKKIIAMTITDKIVELVDKEAERLALNRSNFVEYVLRKYFGLIPTEGSAKIDDNLINETGGSRQ